MGGRAVALITAIVVASVTGCGLQSASGTVLEAAPGTIQHYDSLEGVPVTVAAKDFTEQLILGNMLSIILAAAGADVTNMTNTPGSFGVRQAMLSGDANISPEYTGTGWINYLGNENPIKDPTAQWQAVNEADQANGLTWLPPAPMNNTYAFAIRESEAQRLGVTKLSDLATLDRSELTFCVESEFASRNDGFVPMLQTYDLSRDQLGQVITLDTGVIYTATANGDCNFGEVFTTDGRIPALDLRVLEDDRQFFPLYNLTEVIDTDLLEAHPELAEIFGQLNPRLTNEVMLKLNAEVDNEGRDPALVARDWLIEEGLLSAPS
ncbi:glycine betaine ABC transporter substrate-binding protein [Mycolicibacterium sp. OfavD-34-C]|uniref:glycine betaine ABC transporter substrate-binding protein n=1 Tax=Mycolicibacterium sp. OfavD-34-C TaxID=2917746 RepID=UPI001EF5F142|nr:glycine betaine ABC transporter substrate-binding protein [Mycolicibacterium sp. OfavD-34-C]MCG7582475.1 glycine betaine ABC transporter substrate-binding protein [Mycolicibacterium sp. OfavD-34-C]